jgi:glycosyltransferase involved in cell wall biosynthesis
MKLLIYTHSFMPNIGGVETYAMVLARGLAERAAAHPVDMTLVTQTLKDNFKDTELPFAVVRRPGLAQLIRIIRNSDVVHLAGPAIGPMLLAILFGKRLVVGHHGYQASCPNGLLLYQPAKRACPDHFMRQEYLKCFECNASGSGWIASARMLLLMWPRRWLCRHANVNLSVTRHVAERLQLPHSAVVYHGVPGAEEDLEFRDSPIGSEMEKPAQSFPLSAAFLGRLVQEKGVHTLVKALQLLQAEGRFVRLMIIGDGPERTHLEAMVRESPGLQRQISFTGSVHGEALRDALKNADVLVMPSVNEEPAGLVIMEQMAQGKPVIVSDHGGGPELAGDTGLKFPPGDAAALAKCLKRLADEPGLLERLGANARKRAAALFTLERMVEEHYQIFGALQERMTD